AVVKVVLITAIANVAVYGSTLATNAIYPSIADEEMSLGALRAGLALNTIVSIAVSVLGGSLVLAGLPGAYALATGPLLLGLGTDMLLVAWFVRDDDPTGIMRNRLRYGAINIVLTIPVALLWKWKWSLVVVVTVTYALTIVWVSYNHREGIIRDGKAMSRVRWSVSRDFARSAAPSSCAYVMNVASTQAAALALGGLGSLAPAWAAITRIAGGMASVSIQLIAPSLDAKISRAVRERRTDVLGRTILLGLLTGIPLAVFGPGLGLAAVAVSNGFINLSGRSATLVVVAAFLYWGSSLAVIPLYKSLTLLGHSRARLVWDGLRTALVIAILCTLRHSDLIVGMSAVVAIMNAAFVLLCFRAYSSSRHGAVGWGAARDGSESA
ncbi:MAG: hypothetical protein ACRDRT_13740, partial [Pseudonocardiaceae bacterium]